MQNHCLRSLLQPGLANNLKADAAAANNYDIACSSLLPGECSRKLSNHCDANGDAHTHICIIALGANSADAHRRRLRIAR